MHKVIVSIIVVHYKIKKEFFDCIDSIKKSRPKVSYEIIVVDNDPDPVIEKELKRKFKRTIYITSGSNIGYGAAINLGTKVAKGEYLFCLNQDTLIFLHTIDLLYQFAKKDEKVGCVSPILMNGKGKIYGLQGSGELTPTKGIFVLSFINKYFPNNPISQKFWNKIERGKKSYKVNVVPGTAFFVSKKVFEKVGGFDPNFFLYFEENDFCKRLNLKGYENYILTESKTIHLSGKNILGIGRVEKVINTSRFYYFRKHFGLLPALLVDMFARFGKYEFLLLIILIFGTFLRFYRIEENFAFAGEIGDNLLTLKNAFLTKQIPLVGPATSHPWLYFGPLYYYLYGPILFLSGFNPVSHAYFGAFIGSIIPLANYLLAKELFNKKVAILSTFITSFSPIFLDFSHVGRFFSVIILLTYPIIYLIKKILDRETKHTFLLGFLLGATLSFHYSQLILLPVVLLALLASRSVLTKGGIAKLLLGFLLPNITLLLFDARSGFSMFRNFLLWFPYRVLGFVGIFPKNTPTASSLRDTLVSSYNFLVNGFIPSSGEKLTAVFGGFLFFAIILYSVLLVFMVVKRKLMFQGNMLLLFMLFSGLALLTIHGNPPIHYFVTLLPIPILLFAGFMVRLMEYKNIRVVIFLLVFLMLVMNLSFLFSEKWFYKKNNVVSINPHEVPYNIQKEVARTIISDAEGRSFELARVGPYDQFEKDFSQNYIYLLWLYGNQPKDEADIRYVIYEDPSKLSSMYGKVFRIANMGVLKEKN